MRIPTNENTRGSTGWCLELHDLAVSKLVAGREKDIAFVSAMLKHKLIDANTVRERIMMTANKEKALLAEQRFSGRINLSAAPGQIPSPDAR